MLGYRVTTPERPTSRMRPRPIALGARGLVLLGSLGSLLVAGSAEAGDGLKPGDTAWILVSTAFVLFMNIPGLALFYGGLVRTKNVLSVLMQCLALTGVVTIVWLAFGYSVAFSEGSPLLGGLSKAFLRGITADTLSGSIPEVLFFSFQMTFAIITPALIIGAVAERMRFAPLMLFSVVWVVVVYLPVCHAQWGPGGLLASWGVFDFAGGIVVHVTAGVAALVACIVLGPRHGYGETPIFPHNMTMTVTGTAMLWVGWFGFNGGSALAADGGAAMAITVTHVSAAAAACTWSVVEWLQHGKPSALGFATGAIAGLAAVTPASGYIGPVGGLLIGVTSGVLCYVASTIVKMRLGYDDSLDVFGVHGVGGFVGTIMAGFLASQVFGGNQGDLAMGRQTALQLGAAIGVGLYTAVASWLILKGVAALMPLRPSEQDETTGLDITQHEEAGYRY